MTVPKTLIFIAGPQAVGKMAVGLELSRVTGYKFMSNHQTIEMLLPIFEFGTPSFKRLLFDFRLSIFEEVAASEIPGFIFSYVPRFDSVLDKSQTECYIAPFLRRGSRVLFVELEAPFETRLERNRTEARLHHKPSKRDITFSEQLLHEGEKHRSNTQGDFSYPYPHLKIVNENLSPQEVVREICDHFAIESLL
jgi:hypothetical protein